jgi:biotin transport system substrate-specific component
MIGSFTVRPANNPFSASPTWVTSAMITFIKTGFVPPRMNGSDGYAFIRGGASGTLFRWRNEASWAEKLVLALCFALMTALAAQLRFYLPFSPVPFTGQVFMVLLAAICLGRFGVISQGMYVALGASFGWFSGMTGFSALLGVTGGYLIGFLLASVFLGEMVERRSCWSITSLSMTMMAAVGIIYACGVAQLVLVLHLSLFQAILIGALPFAVVDGIKIALTVGLSSILLPLRE